MGNTPSLIPGSWEIKRSGPWRKYGSTGSQRTCDTITWAEAGYPNGDASRSYCKPIGGPCCKCGIVCGSIEYCGIANRSDKGNKACYYYHFSRSKSTYNVAVGLSGDGMNTSRSETVEEGVPLVKMFSLFEERGPYWCTGCFAKEWLGKFKSTALTLHGSAAIINSDLELHPISVGNYRG